MGVGMMLQWAAIVFTVVVFFWVSHGKSTREKKMALAFLAMALVLNIAYLFELMAHDFSAAFPAVQLEYGSLVFLGYFACLFFALHVKHHVPHWIAVYALVYDLMMLAITWTAGYHDLMFKGVAYVPLVDGWGITFEWGKLYIFLMLGCQLVPSLFALWLLISYFVTHGMLANVKTMRHHTAQAAGRHAQRTQSGLLLLFYAGFASEMLFFTHLMRGSYNFCAPLGLLLADFFMISFWGRKGFHLETTATAMAFAQMTQGVIVVNNAQELLFYNDAAQTIFPELVPKMRYHNLKRLHSIPLELFEDYEEKELELGGRWYEVRQTPIVDAWAAVCGSMLLLTDRTREQEYRAEELEHKKELERAEQETMNALEEAQRAAKSKSEFLANISHEIRTPMNAIVGLSELIIEESRGRKVYDFACDIKQASSNLLLIINDILSLSKLENGQLEFVHEQYTTQQLLEETLHLAKLSASSRGLQLKREISGKLPCALIGDAARLRQILTHFVGFGMKYTERGYVKVTVTHRWLEEEQIELIFQFEDTGVGFTPEELACVFDQIRFSDEATEHQMESVGIGMALIKRFIELMDGSVEAVSTPGKGTSFTVRIPQRVADARSIEQKPWHRHGDVVEEAQRAFIVPDYQVLVVDDNKINLKVACGALAPYQFCVDEAKSGQQAIDLAREKAYDLILMDHMMPEMDGIEATARIRSECGENGEKPVIIALSANAYNNANEMFLSSGFQDFIAKPLDKEELHRVLYKWIPEERRQSATGMPETEQRIVQAGIAELYMTGVDVRCALEAHTGGISDYLELLELYYLDGAEKKELLARLMQEADYPNYEIEVHGLKSASANIGAFEFSELAKRQEFAVKEGNYDLAREEAAKLLSEYRFLLNEIERVLRANGYLKEETEQAEGELLTDEQTRARMQEILETLESFHSKEAAQQAEALSGENIEKSAKECLKDVRNRLRMYDDDTAEDLLRAFLEHF